MTPQGLLRHYSKAVGYVAKRKQLEAAAAQVDALVAALREIEDIARQYSVAGGPAYAMRNIARAALAPFEKEPK